MFNKLVSNLPFNPSLINQVSFYARRLKAESAVRRLGFTLVAFTLLLQMFAVLAPAKPSFARPGNDIIPGGVTSTQQIYDLCVSNTYGLKTILAHFAVSCTYVKNNSAIEYIKANAYNDTLYSMGRQAQGETNDITGKLTDEVTVKINGLDDLYMRKLSSWDSGNNFSTYKALRVGSAFNVPIYILFSCGNIVTIGKPQPPLPPVPPPPPPPPPPPKVILCSNLGMSVANNSIVNINKVINVRGQAAGSNLPAGQLVGMRYDLVNSTGKVIASNTHLKIPFSGHIANDSSPSTFTLKEVGKYRIRLTVTVAPSGRVATGSATGNCLKALTVRRACPAAATSKDLEDCLIESKRATNVTQKIEHANGTTARAGDVITYSLMLHNTGNIKVPATVSEDMSDVLEYADITDLHGGTINNATHIVSWPRQTIPAKTIITHKITIKVKDPIPNTPAPCPPDGTVSHCVSSGSFDLMMTNFYGNSVNIKLPKSIVKITETNTTEVLPNTGPGASVVMVFGLAVLTGYFYYRSRLLSEELDIIRKDFVSNGGA